LNAWTIIKYKEIQKFKISAGDFATEKNGLQ